MAHLAGLEGLAAGIVFALSTDTVTIGRDGSGDIVLMDNTVSRVHARLTRRADGVFTILDLDSLGGVFVNGQRTQQASLATGDLLQIGDSVFRFET